MKMNEDNYIVLIKQFKASLEILYVIKSLGYKIIYIGQEKEVGELSDIWINEPLSRGVDFFVNEIKKIKVTAILTLSEDAILFHNELKERIGLDFLSEDIIKSFRDKTLMNKKLNSLGLPVAKQTLYSENQIFKHMLYPLFVKPTTGYASAGAQRVDTFSELKSAIRTIKRINQFLLKNDLPTHAGVILEEYIDGKEYSLDSLSVNGKTKIFCICERDFPTEDTYQDYIYRSCKKDVEEDILQNMTPILNKLFSSFNYTGPAHTEVKFCRKRKRWYIIESALRVGFSGVIGDYFKELTGINYNALTIQVLLKNLSFEDLERISLDRKKEGVLMILPTFEGGEILEINTPYLSMLTQQGHHYYIHVNPGQRIIPYPKGAEYMGHLIVVESNFELIEKKIEELKQTHFFKYKEA